MGSAFDTLFGRSAVPVFLAVSGETVYYTPKGGSQTTIKALVKRGEGAAEESSEDGLAVRVASEVEVRMLDCPNLTKGDHFRIDSLDYSLESVPHRTPNTATVELKRMVRTEKSDGGTRRTNR